MVQINDTYLSDADDYEGKRVRDIASDKQLDEAEKTEGIEKMRLERIADELPQFKFVETKLLYTDKDEKATTLGLVLTAKVEVSFRTESFYRLGLHVNGGGFGKNKLVAEPI